MRTDQTRPILPRGGFPFAGGAGEVRPYQQKRSGAPTAIPGNLAPSSVAPEKEPPTEKVTWRRRHRPVRVGQRSPHRICRQRQHPRPHPELLARARHRTIAVCRGIRRPRECRLRRLRHRDLDSRRRGGIGRQAAGHARCPRGGRRSREHRHRDLLRELRLRRCLVRRQRQPNGCYGYSHGYTNLGSIGWDNRISSFRSYSNCRTAIFANTNYGGSSYGYYTNSSYVGSAMNDQASSIRWAA